MTSIHVGENLNEHPTSGRDLAYLFLGEMIGQGTTRDVYQFRLDKTCVVKHEPRGERFQNVLEWEIWNTVKDTKFAKFFAPCVDISSNGLFLIQKKAEPLAKSFLPSKVPVFFCDLKPENYGFIGKQIVATDYGTAHIEALNRLMKSMKFKKAEWRLDD